MTEPSPTPSAPEPEQLAPYRIEGARSGRSGCKACRRKIAKGDLRLGVLIEGPFGTGYLWHHLRCAARTRFEQVEEAYAARAWEEGLEVPALEELRKLQEEAAERKQAKKEPPYGERAPSGRSKCRQCEELIAKGALRVALPRRVEFYGQQRVAAVLVHAGCVAAALQAEDNLAEPEQLAQELRANSRDLAAPDLDLLLAEIGETT